MRFGVDRRALSLMAALVSAACAGGLGVSSAQAEGACPNEQLRAEQLYALALPDCRAYEMVSPLDKNDNDITPEKVRASVSGEAVTYSSLGSFSNPVATIHEGRYISRRGPEGWSTQNITPPYKSFYEPNPLVPFEELFFTPDLSKGLLLSRYTALTSGSPQGYENLYVADTSSGSYQAVTGPPPGLPPYEQAYSVLTPHSADVSTDLNHVVFQEYAYEGLTVEALPKKTHVYEWTSGKPTVSLIDIPPKGKTLEAEDTAGFNNPFTGPNYGDEWHAVSADGSRVVFTGGEVNGPGQRREEEHQGQVYVREVTQANTVEVSASQRKIADPNGPKPARYWAASADGSRVFFTSKAELTDDANTGPADNAANLYEYDLETGVLTDLTVDTNAGDVNGAAVRGVVTTSEDGSYVYFVAEGSLAEGAVSSEPNLYLYHAGKMTFIATLTPATSRDESAGESGGDSEDWTGGEDGYGGPGQHSARVSSDGTRLAFQSERSLTGYDTEPAEPGQCASGGCSEVYLYDAGKGTLACASCDPSGARPVGSAQIQSSIEGISPFYVTRNFSEDGSRLFFQGPDPLVSHDSNGRVDVYEYENGHVYPISNVAGNYPSYFLDASPSGNDVFIATADQLVPSDTDARIDLYDVKVGGGFPVSVVPPVCTNGDSCKAPVSPQPGVFGTPASATFSGAGNSAPVVTVKGASKAKAKPKRCKRRFVSRHGRCVRQAARKSNGHSNRGKK